MPSRRELLRMALGASAALACGVGCGRRARKPEVRRPPGRPRYLVMLFLGGGHDTVFTTDPKRREEVHGKVALPSENRIVETAGLRLGPHFAPLAPWASKLAIVNGVQVGTANHDTGFRQFFRLKTNVATRAPTILDLIGSRRDGQPLGAIYLNLTHRVEHSPGYFGSADQFYFGPRNIFEEAEQAEVEELRAAAAALREEAHALRARSRAHDAEVTAHNMTDVAAFFERMADIPPLTIEPASPDYVAQTMAAGFERAAWILQHDLARCVGIDLGLLGWDTHIRNEHKQTEMNGYFVRFLGDFLRKLETRRNPHGLLVDQTLIVGGSDLGRFPEVNDMLGKDHFPHTSFFFLGPGVPGGRTFGRTGPRMQPLPISYRTGESDQHGRVPMLDDVGTTLLAMDGHDPERYGYTGRRFEFLLDAS